MDCTQAGAHTQKQNQDFPSPALAPTCPGAPQLKEDKHTAIKWVTLRYACAPSARDSAREGQTRSLLRFAHGRTRTRTHKSRNKSDSTLAGPRRPRGEQGRNTYLDSKGTEEWKRGAQGRKNQLQKPDMV